MIAAARNARVHLIVGHSHSFDAPILRTRDLIASGAYGAVRMIHALNYTDFLYRPRRPEELDTTQGGGAVFNQAAHQADIVRLIGLPEGLFPLTQATIYLAKAPKSAAVKKAYFAAAADAAETAREPVPLHLRNAVTPLMKQFGYGKDYRYVHEDPAAKDEMSCLPEQLKDRKYFSDGD